MVSSFTRLLNHTRRRATVGRTPLNECLGAYIFKNNQQIHFLTVLLLNSISPTSFDARASSSGRFAMPTELHANFMVSSG
jgi:hypothetical protein